MAKVKAQKTESIDSSQNKKVKARPTMADLLASSGYNIFSLRRRQEVKGKIVSVSPQEILIDIGGKSEGIVSGRELASVRDLASKLSIGDSVDVTVLYPENDAGQIVLSLRKLSGEKRWDELEDKKENGEEFGVVAVEANRGGVICDYVGLRGFLPSSQLSASGGRQSQSNPNLSGLLGKTLSVHVIEVDRQTNRLIFSQKQSEKKDLAKVIKLLSKVDIGQKIDGVVTAVLPFGVFVEIEVGGSESQRVRESESQRVRESESQGVRETESQRVRESEDKLEGLVHISEISWEKIDDVAKFFKVGDKVEVIVIAKDNTTGRLNLSIKQLLPDPFLEVSAKYTKDQPLSGMVARVTPKGVFITLDDGLEGLISISKISPEASYELGETVECLVDSIDAKGRHVTLSPVVREKPILYR